MPSVSERSSDSVWGNTSFRARPSLGLHSHRSFRCGHAASALLKLGGLLRHLLLAGRGRVKRALRERLQLGCGASGLWRAPDSFRAGHGTAHDAGESRLRGEVVFLKLYKRDGFESPDKALGISPTLPEPRLQRRSAIPRARGGAPEPSGNSASVTTSPALVSQADNEVFLWDKVSSFES